MSKLFDVLVATINQKDSSLIDIMNLKQSDVIITNQSNHFNIIKNSNYIMITTDTKGVGVNRNIGILLSKKEYILITDDDMVFNDDFEKLIEEHIKNNLDLDIIIYNFDYYKDNRFIKKRFNTTQKVHLYNCLRHGICCTLIKKNIINKHQLYFTTLFGGGSKYGSGEDSLFFLECVKKGFNILQSDINLGRNVYRPSTWFKGYTEKFFFDKGAWLSCAFPKMKYIMTLYFAIRFKNKSDFSLFKIIKLLIMGIKDFEK